jgi:hypothetical protein
MKQILIAFLLCSMSTCLNAQNIRTSTVTWTSNTFFNMNSGELSDELNVIISSNNSTVEWKKSDGTSETFIVNEVIGQWMNVNSTGEAIYEISNDSVRGNITFTRNSLETKIKMILIKESIPMIYELTDINYQSN